MKAQSTLHKFIFCLCLLIPLQLQADTVALIADAIIDGVNDQPVTDVAVIVDGNIIADIAPEKDVSPRMTRIDLSGMTLMPGLIDSHSHPLIHADDYQLVHLQTSSAYKALKGMKSLERLLAAGWTTIRVMGDADVHYANQDIRRVIEEGVFEGPRIFGAGHYISTTAGGGDIRFFSPEQHIIPDGLIVNGVDEMRRAIRQEIKYGSDWIKLLVTGAFMSAGDNPKNVHFSPEELAVAVAEAGRFNVPVAAHAHATEGIKMAVTAGVRSIEHGTYIDEEVMDMMAERGTFLVPTLYIGEVLADEENEYREEDVHVEFKNTGQADLLRRIGEAHRRGVKIAAGVDLGGYHHDPTQSARELAALIKAGLSPMDAIKAATAVGAQLLGKENELGAIRSGLLADLIAVDGNPINNISNMEKVRFVMKDGRIIKGS